MTRSLPKSIYDLSIIIPTLNNIRVLEQCLSSIQLNTTKVNYEIIVHANACTKDTAEFLAKWQKVKAIKSENNLYFTTAVNRSIQQAQGEYVLLLNDDCEIIRDDWFITYISLLTEDSRIAAVGPHWKNIDELPYGWIEPYASFYKRDIFNDVGLLPYYNEDFVLWWSDIYHSYSMMNKGYYIRPLSRSLSDTYFLHKRAGESGKTVLTLKPSLPESCFNYHGKETMYRRLKIENESNLMGYYRSSLTNSL